MNKDVISFIPASFGSFLGLVFTFGVLGFLIHFILHYPSWCGQAVMTLAGPRCWQGMIRGKNQEELLG
jgi:hypothetical protein